MHAVNNGVKEISIEAVVIRANGQREPLGQIAYWSRNPLKRWSWWLKRKLAGH